MRYDEGPKLHPSLDQLYVCDLDGTLLRSDASLSAHAQRSLLAMLEAGCDTRHVTGHMCVTRSASATPITAHSFETPPPGVECQEVV